MSDAKNHQGAGFCRTLRQLSLLALLLLPLASAWAESSEDQLIEEFNQLVREYRFADAQGVLDKAVKAYPGNPVFPMQLVSFRATLRGYIEVQQSIIDEEATTNPGRALRSARRILSVQPGHEVANKTVATLADGVSRRIEPLLAQCQAELGRGDTEAARETLSTLLTLDPADPRIRALLSALDEKAEDRIREQEREARKTLANIEVLAKAGRTGNAKEEARRLQRVVEHGLVQKPGDENLLALAKRAQEVLGKGSSKDERQVSKALAETVASYGETAERQMERGRKLLAEGRFGEAEALFSTLVRSGGLSRIAISYLYQGIARLAQTRTADISAARQQQLKARASFLNALRFDAAAVLPAGYEKYAKELSEARQLL